MSFVHQPVLLEETLLNLDLKNGKKVIDCTLGSAGHAKEILKKISPVGFLLAFDLSDNSISRAKENLKGFEGRYKIVKDNFKNIKKYVSEGDFDKYDAVLLDLGLAFYQYKEEGFGLYQKGKLDFRLDKSQKLTAEEILTKFKEAELEKIFREYGEERYSRRIAREIKKQGISKIEDLKSLLEHIYKGRKSLIHPATKVFQALRIAVNDELENLKSVLNDSLDVLAPGGRIAVISYHSLEDRIVKNFFRDNSKTCVCPPDFPKCVCGQKARIKIITKKPIIAGEEELERNPSSRSAKLRAAEKI